MLVYCGAMSPLRLCGQMTMTTMISGIGQRSKDNVDVVLNMLCGSESQEQVVLESDRQADSRWCR